MKTSRVAAAAALTAGALMLGACSGNPVASENAAEQSATPASSGQEQTAPPQTGEPEATTTAPAGDPAAEGSAASFGIDPSNPPAAIATVTGPPKPGSKVDKVTYELVDLQRRDNLLVGLFRVTATGGFADAHFMDLTSLGWGPKLVDPANLTMYSPVAQLTRAPVKVLKDQPVYATAAWAYPSDVRAVDIQVVDSLPMMQAVQVPQ